MDSYRTVYDSDTVIAKNLDHVANYNTMTRTDSTETVWARETATSAKCAETATESNSRTTLQMNDAGARTDYDPYDFGNTEKPTSFWGTVSNLIIVSAGPTILSLPISFLEVGYVVGLVSTMISTFLYAYSVQMLIWSEYEICKYKRVPSLSYPDVIYFAFKDGPSKFKWFAEVGKYTIDVVFIALWASGCCYNLELAAENIQLVYNEWFKSSLNGHQVLGWLMVPVLLLCYVPRLKYLVPVSALANVANVLCILAVVYDVVFSKRPFEGGPAIGSLLQLPVFLGTLFFTLNATGLMLPLKKDMEHPRRFGSAFGILTVTYVPAFFMFSLFGLLCTLKYGKHVKETVTQNIQAGHAITQYTVLANALALVLQFPLYFFIVFEVLWNSLLKERRKKWNGLKVREYLLRTTITVVIFLVTYVVPSVELFLTFAGAVGTMIDSLLFPACIQMAVMWKVSEDGRRLRRCLLKNTAIVVLAVALMVSGGASCIGEVIKFFSAKKAANLM